MNLFLDVINNDKFNVEEIDIQTPLLGAQNMATDLNKSLEMISEVAAKDRAKETGTAGLIRNT